MPEPPANPGNEGQPTPDDVSTVRDSQAMLRGEQQDPLIGTTVGQYTIKRVIGSGGMGTVYEALQQSPRRTVALKMMKQGITSRNALRRFEYEAQTLGRLRHDNIAQIYEASTHDDGTGTRPFFAMEYIAGAKPLTTYARDKKFGTRERLELFSKVCDAVQHGHQKGIIHRDLKPPNILVTSSGVPKIIDFGVARSTDSDLAVTTLQTDVGALIGTLQYMSPEQCAADPNDIDTRSDVYALGVVLYELLCDSLPYDVTRVAIAEAARIVQQEEPTKPSTVDKRLRGDVETIALKALEKDRDRRYQSATALEDDINRYLAGEAITAKAPSAIDYLKRFARKHKAAAISIAAIFVVLVGAVITISIFAAEAQRQRRDSEFRAMVLLATEVSRQEEVKKAEQAQAEAEQATAGALRSAYYASLHAASASLSEEDVTGAKRWLDKAMTAQALNQLSATDAEMVSMSREQMPFEWRYLHAQSDDSIATLRGHESPVHSVAFSPDGTRLALGSSDGTTWLWDVTSGEKLSVLRGHEELVFALTFSLDSTRLASVSDDKTTRIWDVGSGEELAVLPGYEDRYGTNAFSPDGTRLATADPRNGDAIRLWDASSGEELSVLSGHESIVRSVTFSPDGTRLASGSEDGTIRLWDAGSGEELAVLDVHKPYYVLSVTFSPDGTRLASGSSDGTVRLWDAGSGEELLVLDGQNNSVGWPTVGSVTFSPDGTRLAARDNYNTIQVWDAGSGEELSVLRGIKGGVSPFTFSPDGTRLASGCGDKTIRLWDAGSGEELAVLRGHEGVVSSVTFSSDGTRLASAGKGDKTIRFWVTASSDELSDLRGHGHESWVWSVTFSPDGQRLASASSDSTIRIWGASSGEELTVLRGHEGYVRSIAFSPDGTRLASGGNGDTIRLWDVGSGEELFVLRGHESLVNSLTFSPDGTRLASAGWDETIRLWDVATGEELSVLRGHEENVNSVTFSPDGQRLASAGGDKTSRLWDAGSGEELSVLRGHENQVISVTFSPDGQRLASGSYDNTIRLWDVGSGEELSVLRGHKGGVGSVTFSPDGQRLASGGGDNTIRLWDAGSGEELAVLRGHEDGVGSVTFSPDGTRLASGSYDNTIRLWETRSLGQIAQDRRLAQEEMLRLTPLVETWIEKADGDSELVVAMLDREVKDRTPEEATTLRNLVLKKLSEHRQAKEAEADEPAVP